MRDFLNAILAFIGASSLTDIEFAAVNALNLTVGEYTIYTYNELSKVLISRDAVSTTTDRLRYFFLSKAVDVPSTAPADAKVASNIFLGSAL